MRIVWFGLIGLVALVALLLTLDLSAIGYWAVEQQRAFQNQMAGAIRALKSGEPTAYVALFAATGAYGFVHALGPGHGKYLVGGVGLGTSISISRLVSIAAASSIVQALWAILLVYGGFYLISITAQQMTYMAEDILAPASYLAIACVGVVLVLRGTRRIASGRTHRLRHQHAHDDQHDHAHHHHHHAHGDENCGCGGHGPTAHEIERASSLRDAMILIASVSVRPCTGAIFLLVIAWQMDILLAGALSVIVMGLGTAALTSLVALSSVVARRLALATTAQSGMQATVFSTTQVFVGIAIVWLSLAMLSVAV